MATIRRTATAAWQGTGKEGTGTLTTQSGVLRRRAMASRPASPTGRAPIRRS